MSRHPQITSMKLVFVFFLMIPLGYSQTFRIDNRSNPTNSFELRVDQTIEVTFNVSATGFNGTAIPQLVPRDANQAAAISATWDGSGPTSNFSNLRFFIHLYDTDQFCGSTFEFDMIFTSSSFVGPRTATTSNANLTRFGTSQDGVINLTKRIAQYLPSLPLPIQDGYDDFNSYTAAELASSKLYFYADWDLANYILPGDNNVTLSFNSAFALFQFDIAPDNCVFDLRGDLFQFGDAEDLLITGEVRDENDDIINTGPLGGNGNTVVNIFDITDVVPGGPCGSGTMTEVFDILNSRGLILHQGPITALGITLREFGFYLGQEGGCISNGFVFGEPRDSTDFRFQNVTLGSNGRVAASLVVPTAWTSGSTLNNNYTVEYYLRSDTTMTRLNGIPTNALNFDVPSIQAINDPEDFYLEARITHVSDAVVSVTNQTYNHDLRYTNQVPSFQGQELTIAVNDNILDPGETVFITTQVEALSGNLPGTLEARAGWVIDNGNGIVDGESTDTYVTANGANPSGLNVRIGNVNVTTTSPTFNNTTTSFELLTAPTQPRVWFFLESSYRDPVSNTDTTYRRFVSLRDTFNTIRDLNAQDTNLRSSFDFNTSSFRPDWDEDNQENNAGWSYSTAAPGPWVGNGGDSVSEASDIHSLVSPYFELGSPSRLDFVHLPRFTFNQSAGMIEYRTRQGVGFTPTSWSNLIDDFGPNNVYNDLPYPATPVSYFSGKGVWMSDESTPSSVAVSLPSSLSAQYNGDGQVQFRFVFGDPSLIDTARSSGPTNWEVREFEYSTNKLLEDNIFRVDLDSLNMDACLPELTFYSDRPIQPSALNYEWYESLTNLYNGASVTGDESVPPSFDTANPGTYTFYVRITSVSNTSRIYQVNVTRVPDACDPDTCFTQDDINNLIRQESDGWPSTRSVLNFIDVVRLLCDETEITN